jgi:hypothetical protein
LRRLLVWAAISCAIATPAECAEFNPSISGIHLGDSVDAVTASLESRGYTRMEKPADLPPGTTKVFTVVHTFCASQRASLQRRPFDRNAMLASPCIARMSAIGPKIPTVEIVFAEAPQNPGVSVVVKVTALGLYLTSDHEAYEDTLKDIYERYGKPTTNPPVGGGRYLGGDNQIIQWCSMDCSKVQRRLTYYGNDAVDAAHGGRLVLEDELTEKAIRDDQMQRVNSANQVDRKSIL